MRKTGLIISIILVALLSVVIGVTSALIDYRQSHGRYYACADLPSPRQGECKTTATLVGLRNGAIVGAAGVVVLYLAYRKRGQASPTLLKKL